MRQSPFEVGTLMVVKWGKSFLSECVVTKDVDGFCMTTAIQLFECTEDISDIQQVYPTNSKGKTYG